MISISFAKVFSMTLRRTFWVGVFPGLTPPMLDHIADSILEFITNPANHRG